MSAAPSSRPMSTIPNPPWPAASLLIPSFTPGQIFQHPASFVSPVSPAAPSISNPQTYHITDPIRQPAPHKHPMSPPAATQRHQTSVCVPRHVTTIQQQAGHTPNHYQTRVRVPRHYRPQRQDNKLGMPSLPCLCPFIPTNPLVSTPPPSTKTSTNATHHR